MPLNTFKLLIIMDKSKLEKDKELLVPFTSTYDFKSLTNRIAEYLYSYTIRTRIHYDRERPKAFGAVGFWLEEKDGNIMLMYNIHPKDWNVKIIASQFEMEEKRFYDNIQNGSYNSFSPYQQYQM